MVPPVALVHVLDDLFTPVALDVEVDVGRAVALGRQEPLEQQPQRDGVGLGDPEGVADRAVGGAAPALAEDVGPVAELDDVPHHEEVAGETEALDHLQLVVDRAPRPCPQRQVLPRRRPVAVAAARAVQHDLAQVLHLGERPAVGSVRARERRQRRRHQRQVERRGATDLGRELDHPRVPQEPPRLFGTAAQMRRGRGRQPRVELVEAAPRPHRGHRHGELPLRGRGVVDVVGGDARQVEPAGQLGERVVAGRVERIAVVPQLHHHPVAPEQLHQPLQLPPCRARPVGQQRGGHRALAAPGEHPPVPRRRVGEVAEGELRRALLAREVPEAERSRQAGVAVGAVGEHQQVVAVRIGFVTLVVAGDAHLLQGVLLVADHACVGHGVGGDGDLRAEHRGQPHGPGRLGEAHHAVQAVVVGERERLEPQAGRFLGQLLGVRGAVEEREVRVAVQLGVGRGRGVGPHERPGGVGIGRPERGLERLTLAAPRRAVATGVPRRRTGRPPVLAPHFGCLRCLALTLFPLLPLLPGTRLLVLFGRPATRQQRFDVLPGHARVVEAHRDTVSNTCSIAQDPARPEIFCTEIFWDARDGERHRRAMEGRMNAPITVRPSATRIPG